MIRNKLHASASLIAIAAAFAAPAFAQDVETVTITGFRQSMITSQAIKKESVNLVEAVSAEDIGKLPDTSIADSLARLPGLAAQRVDGRSQVIAIRGLSPDFAGTTFNGRDQVSTGDNRGVEFDQYPAEILTGVVVYKTADPTIVGAGLSGTVDLKSARPLDYESRQLAFGARGEYNSLGNMTPEVSPFGKRFNFTYIDQFLDRKLGIAMGYAHLDSPFQEQHYKAWWWGLGSDLVSWGGNPIGQPLDSVALEGAEVWARSKEQIRDSIVTTVEFQPNEHWHSVLDVYWSNFNQKEYMHGAMWSADAWASYPTDPFNPAAPSEHVSMSNVGTSDYLGTKLVTSGAWHNLRPVVRNDYNKRVDGLASLGWRNEFSFGKATIIADISYSNARRNEQQMELYAGRTSLSDVAFTIPVRPMFPTLKPSVSWSDPAGVVLFDAQNWGHGGRIGIPEQKDTIQAARLDAKYDFDGFIDSVEIGANFQTRQKSRTYAVLFANLKSQAPQVSSDLLYDPVSLDFAGFGDVMAFRQTDVLNKYYTTAASMSADDLRKDFKVKEKVLTSYAKVNYNTALYGIDLKGSIGGQLIHTDQESTALNVNDVAGVGLVITPAHSGKSYWDFLPAITMVADFGEGSILRIGLAKTMARPRMDELRASSSAAIAWPTPGTWAGNGGNPKLSPWRANSVDVSLEHYISDSSYVAVAGFYKSLTSYVYNQDILFDFTGYVDPNGHTALTPIGSYNSPANGKGGYVRGMEFTTQLDGNLLWNKLDGFGAIFSFSWTDTSIKPNGPGTAETATLPGLSKAVGDFTLYYEKDGFSVRVAEKYRSDFRGEITYLYANRVFTRILAEAQTDFQMSYDFQAGSMEGLSVLLQVNNLFNSPYRTVQDSNFTNGGRQPQEYNLYGRQILLGLNYKL